LSQKKGKWSLPWQGAHGKPLKVCVQKGGKRTVHVLNEANPLTVNVS